MNILSNSCLAIRETTGTVILGSGLLGTLMGIEGVTKYPFRRFYKGDAEKANDGVFIPIFLQVPVVSLCLLDCVADEDVGQENLDELSRVYWVWKRFSNYTE